MTTLLPHGTGTRTAAPPRAATRGRGRRLEGSLGDLSDNLDRLRAQLRDIELQAETQIGTRMEAARAAAQFL